MLPIIKALSRLFLFLLLPVFSFAQTGHRAFAADEAMWQNSRVDLFGLSQYASNSFKPSQVTSFILGNTVDDTYLDNLATEAQDVNRVFYQDGLNVAYRHVMNEKTSITVSLSQGNFSSITAPSTAFQFAAYGNTPFKGETIDIELLKVQYFACSKLRLGYMKTLDLCNGQFQLQLGASLVQGQNLIDIEVNNSSLFTEENAEYLDLTYDYDYTYLNQAAMFSGVGFDLNLEARYWKENKFALNAWVRDLGNVYWSGNEMESGSARGQISYEGLFFSFEELSNFGSNNEIQNKADSLRDLLRADTRNSKTLSLPYNLGVSYTQYIGDGEALIFSGQFVPGYYERPVGSIRFRHFIDDNLNASLSYCNGPFGGSAFDMTVGYQTKRICAEVAVNGFLRVSAVNVPLTGGWIRLNYFI